MSSKTITGTKNYEEYLDKIIFVLMSNEKYYSGIFRSFDQFQNITLESAFELENVNGRFIKTPMGLYIIRGESVVFIGFGDSERLKFEL